MIACQVREGVFPGWVSSALTDASRRGLLPSWPRGAQTVTRLMEAAGRCGLLLDHPGRVGDLLAFHVSRGRLPQGAEAGLDRLANVLGAEWARYPDPGAPAFREVIIFRKVEQ